jgi:hypothetical protein
VLRRLTLDIRATLDLAAIVLVAMFCGPQRAAAQSGESGAAFGWRGDYRAAKAEAKKSGKPLMVVFRCVP